MNNSFDNIISINLPASKSISNRVLILEFLSKQNLFIKNISKSNDTLLMLECIRNIHDNKANIDCKDAGTVFRFLTSVLSITPGNWILTGTERMQQRPIHTLVDTLKGVGANITYLKEEGYPPIQIQGCKLEGGDIYISSLPSSQFISSLMMIAPFLPKGLKIHVNKKQIPSFPYVKMTAKIMHHFSLPVLMHDAYIEIPPSKLVSKPFTIENDWSAASYFYECVALKPQLTLSIEGLFSKSLQGDSIVCKWFEQLGVQTMFVDNQTILSNIGEKVSNFKENFKDCPDLAQTFAVCCAALKIPATLSGLSSLRIKETDRLNALSIELGKMGIDVLIEGDTLHIPVSDLLINKPIDTYNDHRMAMAFAPLILLDEKATINNKDVVKKSFPNFWVEFNKLRNT